MRLAGLEWRVPVGEKHLLLGATIKMQRHVGNTPQERKNKKGVLYIFHYI